MLKEELIPSIEALLEGSKNPERIRPLLDYIKENDKISDTPRDYLKALKLIHEISVSWHDEETNPGKEKLAALTLLCAEHAKPLLPKAINDVFEKLKLEKFTNTLAFKQK